jgi:hypothetical protein
MQRDGIEIHFDGKRGYLELACESDAFAAYREVARAQLADFKEIPVGEVIEINVVDADASVARRRGPRRMIWGWVVASLFILTTTLAVVGLLSVVRWIVR